MTTQRKKESNRRNSLKSTGPRTPRGKNRSSRNSLTHGLFARCALTNRTVNRESSRDFNDLLNRLRHDYRPRDAVEDLLVERIADCTWRLRRVHRFEAGAIREGIEGEVHPSRTKDSKETAPPPDPHKMDPLAANRMAVRDADKEENQLRSRIEKLRTEVIKQQQYLDQLESAAQPGNEAQIERLHQNVKGLVKYLDESPPPDLTPSQLHMVVLANQQTYVRDTREKLTSLQENLKKMRRDARRRESRRSLLASLPSDRAVDKLVRYESMLDRQLHRSIAALERRRKQSATK